MSLCKPAGDVLMKEKKCFKFTTQVQPLRLAKWDNDDKIRFFNRERTYTLGDFEIMANKEASRRYSVSGCLPPAYLEKEFWDEMVSGRKGSVEYAINVDGSAFSSSESKWNLKAFSRLNGCALRLLKKDIPGVTRPMLYVGMLFSMFAWHVEDHYLYSINYHHCGAPKTWYGVPGSSAYQFEKAVQNYVYKQEILSMKNEHGAFNVLAEKTTMFPPKVLLQQGIPVYKTVQMPGEFVITFPRAYHAGFSHGFNCGEAVNFAASDWYTFGTEASHRYALLRRMPIIPHEELVCKEAMLISQSSTRFTRSSTDLASLCSLKDAFVSLMKMHHNARWRISELKPYLTLQSKSEGTIFCTLCRRDCFVGYYSCKCYADPICLFHESLTCKCSCGNTSNIIIQHDMAKMEGVAKIFYQENGIRREVESQVKRLSYLWESNNSFELAEDGYVPFSEMKRTKMKRLKNSKIICHDDHVTAKSSKKKKVAEFSPTEEENVDMDSSLSSFISMLGRRKIAIRAMKLKKQGCLNQEEEMKQW